MRRDSTLAPLGASDPLKWRLDSSDQGRHVWHYIRPDDDAAVPYELLWGADERNVRAEEQSLEAKHALGLALPAIAALPNPDGHPYDAARKGAPQFRLLSSEIDQISFQVMHSTRDSKAKTVTTRESTEVSHRTPQSQNRAYAVHTGPNFLIPGLLITLYVTNTPIPQEWKIEISRYLANIQRKGGLADDGWGM